jgi:hypothetical protein
MPWYLLAQGLLRGAPGARRDRIDLLRVTGSISCA